MRERIGQMLRCAVAAMVCIAMTVPVTSFAQQPDPQEILRLLASAKEKEGNEEWSDALEDYQAAFELYPDNSLLYRMGVVSERKGDLFGAVEYFERFVDAVPDDEQAKKVEARLPDLRASLPARITIESTPPGASIYVDSLESAALGTTPATVDVEPGDRSIFVQLEGHETELRNVGLEAGEKTRMNFELVEETTFMAEDEPQRAVSEGMSSLGLWGWVTTGIGVATLATGGVFSVLTMGAEDDVNSYDKRAAGASQAEIDQLKDDADSRYTTSVILYVAGGVITAGGITMLVLDGLSEESGHALRFDVAPTRDGGWVGVSGQF